jgi:outer membrane protein assembly factor BamB
VAAQRHTVGKFIAVLCAVVALSGSLQVAPPTSVAAIDVPWPTSAQHARRTSVAPDQTPFTAVNLDWSQAVDGAVDAQPLLFNQTVYVATENNSVFAFDSLSGARRWQTSLGSPALPSDFGRGSDGQPCGGSLAATVGIRSTPVVDPTTGRLYVVGMVRTPLPHYELWTLETNTGVPLAAGLPIDPWPGTATQKAQQAVREQQRAALSLADGFVYAGFGGRSPACGAAANWMAAVPVHGGAPLAFDDGSPLETSGPDATGALGSTVLANGAVWSVSSIAAPDRVERATLTAYDPTSLVLREQLPLARPADSALEPRQFAPPAAGDGHIYAVAGGMLTAYALTLAAPASAADRPAADDQPVHASLLAAAAPSTGSWVTFGHDAHRSGVDPDQPPFSAVTVDWTVDVDGDVYAQPLVWNGVVYVATELNSVFAFNATTGALLWHRVLGTPAASHSVTCTNLRTGSTSYQPSNINPSLGITSTPVIDPATGRLYAVTEQGLPSLHYELWTLDLNNGGAPIGEHPTIDPWPGTPAEKVTQTRAELDRPALLLANNYVYAGWGGRTDNCQYHGWLAALPVAGQAGGELTYQVPSGRGGAIWATGGAVLGPNNNVYVSTGNSFQENPASYDFGEAVLKLSPTLNLLDWWAPSNWVYLNHNDFDVGSVSPTMLDNGLVFQSGKEGSGYLLRDSNLGHIGGQAFSSPTTVCRTNSRSYGSGMWVPPRLYLPCTDGIKALEITTTGTIGFRKLWDGPSTSYPGSPIMAGNAIWFIDAGNSLLYALDPVSGHAVFQATLPTVAQHFSTPASGNGHIYAATYTRLTAYRLTASGPAPTSTPTRTPLPTSTRTPTPTHTPTPTPTGGGTSVTLIDVADTYIDKSNPASAAGGARPSLRAHGGTPYQVAFLRFDLTALSGKTITAARLRLHTTADTGSGTSSLQKLFFVSDDNWKQQWMSWENDVAISTNQLGTIIAPNQNTWYSGALSASGVQSNTGNWLSIAVVPTSSDTIIFSSREAGASVAPQLVLTYR